NKNSLKFNDEHIEIFNASFLPDDLDKTFEEYLTACKRKNLNAVSKATVRNFYKAQKEKLTQLINAKNIDHLHTQFIKPSDCEIFLKQFDCNKETPTQLVNSIGVLEMLSYKNLKSEIKQLGVKTKGKFFAEVIRWVQQKDWIGLN